MSKPIIEVKNLSKVYNIGHEQKSAPGTLTFRDSLTQTLRKPLEIFTGHRIEQEKFWALKGINFEVSQGDVVGIIGRNGSGKSTLLKVLSRIVEPTEGEVTMRGRVASLLEVGTGFHPELTGRENVYFNGAILGMSQKEIKSKFDEIVAFSEVEKFLDTPVKFYSSGMYVRLAFAVAAHLDPDILIVDEVLAVGDAAFQKKCLGKMKDVAGQGRTVLFVSHSMSAVSQLCNKGIFLEKGSQTDGVQTIEKAIGSYMSSGKETEKSEWRGAKEHSNKIFTPHRFAVTRDDSATASQPLSSNGDNYILIEGVLHEESPKLKLGYTIYNNEGLLLYTSLQTDGEDTSWPSLKKGPFAIRSMLPKRLLNEGEYRLELTASIHGERMLAGMGYPGPAIRFDVSGGLSDSTFYTAPREGVVAPIIKWERRDA